MRDFDKITFTPKRYFPGGNTARGFVNNFGGIVPPWSKNHYSYVIKGGPGTGKSTLMKKISRKAMELGFITEEFHCSGDPESLDAVRIPGKRMVLLDGTAPHSIDPKVPGAGQEVLNLGLFKKQEELRRLHPVLEDLIAENSYHYTVAYSYLAAAGELRRSAVAEVRRIVRLPLLRSCILDFLSPEDSHPGVPARKLFISAITHKGIIDLSKASPRAGLSISVGGVLGSIFLLEAEKLITGRKAEVFCDRLLPEYPEQIHLPDSRLSFILSSDEDTDIECKEFLEGVIPAHVNFAVPESDRLVLKAVEQLKICKEIHDDLELRYREFVDFQKIDRLSEEIMEKIFT